MNSPVGYGTGLRYAFDTRNADYPVAAVLDAAAPVSRQWRLTQRQDQGQTPRCVGYSLAQELNAEPVEIPLSEWSGPNIYNLAQKLDEWPGEGYEGTSLLAGIKALVQYGAVTEYRWAASVEDIMGSLSQIGPVTMAGPWTTGMFTPDNEGRVHVTGTAGNIGHCYLIGELDVAKGRVFIEQTWGPNWSVLGWRGWLALEDVRLLLSMGTQAAIITGRADPWAVQPDPIVNHIVSVTRDNGEVVRTEYGKAVTVDNRQVWP